jgi:hypothetical protein
MLVRTALRPRGYRKHGIPGRQYRRLARRMFQLMGCSGQERRAILAPAAYQITVGQSSDPRGGSQRDVARVRQLLPVD